MSFGANLATGVPWKIITLNQYDMELALDTDAASVKNPDTAQLPLSVQLSPCSDVESGTGGELASETAD